MVERRSPDLDAVFHALSDSTRRSLLRTVSRGGEHTVTGLASRYPMSLAAVSKHLDVLERSSLIRRTRHGKQRLVSLNAHPLEAAQEWLAFYQQFWSDKLDKLQAQLEQEP